MKSFVKKGMQVMLLLCAALTVRAEAPNKSADAGETEGVDWVSRFADEPEPDAKIVYVNGLPKIWLNGEILDPVFNQSGVENDYKVRAAKKTASMGITINQIITRSSDYEVSPGVYSFEKVEQKVLKLLETVPEARIILALRMDAPMWVAAHPEEAVEYAGGPIEKDCNDDYRDRVFRPSAASQAYRDEVRSFLNQLSEFVLSQPWSKRVIGIRPSWGVYTEWHVYAFDQGPDIGPAMTAAFHRWKGGIYANENPPTMEERLDAEDPFFLDRAKHQKVIDYFECMANEVSDCLLEFAHITKQVFPGRLVGMYYGYVMTPHAPEGANAMLDKVLSSPDVDYLSNPADYYKETRLAGGAYYQRTVPATYQRYGKLALCEDDMRHYHVYDLVSHQFICTRSEAEAEMTTRRNWLNQYFDASGIQLLDPETNADRRPFLMDTPPVWRAIEDSRRVLGEIGGRPEDSGNEVAVVVDWRERFRRATGDEDIDVFARIYRYSLFGLYASGVPFDLLTLDDYLAKPANRYHKVVFLNVVQPEGKMKAALRKHVRTRGTKTAWLIKCPLRLSARRATVYSPSDLPVGNDSWKQVLDNLGATPIGPVGHLIRRHGDVVMFHTGEAGTYTLSMPENMQKVKELYSGKEYDSAEVVVTTEGPDTFVFKAIK